MKRFVCPECKCNTEKPNGQYNRAVRAGLPIYCGKKCAGIARRKNKTREQRKEEKRIYDMAYRAKNKEMLKVKKSTYYKLNHNPEKEAEYRKANMARHIEYCRRPEYKEWKQQYDRRFRAKKLYGEFWESSLVLNDIETEILSRASRYELDLLQGRLNKSALRRRDYERLISN